MPLLTKVNNTSWYKTHHWVKTSSSTWVSVPQIYVKTGAGWKPLYTFTWEVGPWGSCSKLCATGTQTRTVRCKRQDGQYVSDSVCTKLVGAKPATSQNCNTHACKYYAEIYYDDEMWLHAWNGSSFDQINYSSGAISSYKQISIEHPSFGSIVPTPIFTAMHDWNGTSYQVGLKMCKSTNECSETIWYAGHQGECDGGKLWFTWDHRNNAIVRYRCTGWCSSQCSGCSLCTDTGVGYINCSSGAPDWAYVDPIGCW